MQDISTFFDKFKKILTNDSIQKEKVAEIVGEVLLISIDPKNITIKNGTAQISGSAVLRNEILLRRYSILERLKSHPSTAAIKEVR
jgi:hypothetical protein